MNNFKPGHIIVWEDQAYDFVKNVDDDYLFLIDLDERSNQFGDHYYMEIDDDLILVTDIFEGIEMT